MATAETARKAGEKEPPPPLDPSAHHHIGLSENLPEHVGAFIREHSDYPGISVRSKLLVKSMVVLTFCNT